MLYDESLTRPKSRKLGIFLGFIFIFVSLLIFLWGYKYYKDAVSTTDKEIESTTGSRPTKKYRSRKTQTIVTKPGGGNHSLKTL